MYNVYNHTQDVFQRPTNVFTFSRCCCTVNGRFVYIVYVLDDSPSMFISIFTLNNLLIQILIFEFANILISYKNNILKYLDFLHRYVLEVSYTNFFLSNVN